MGEGEGRLSGQERMHPIVKIANLEFARVFLLQLLNPDGTRTEPCHQFHLRTKVQHILCTVAKDLRTRTSQAYGVRALAVFPQSQ